jgi:hypothetical protein
MSSQRMTGQPLSKTTSTKLALLLASGYLQQMKPRGPAKGQERASRQMETRIIQQTMRKSNQVATPPELQPI